MTLGKRALESLTAAAGELYSLPTAAIDVLALTNNPRVDVRQLKAAIENDPALTVRILRVVNSSLFGMSKEVTDLNQALALLGVKPLKLLVLGFSLPDDLFAEIATDVLHRYWRHTLVRAVAARELWETIHRGSGDEVFIAGLLRDLGMLVLVQQIGQPYIDFIRQAQAQGASVGAREREVIGFDRTQLTARLLAQWQLPDTLVWLVEDSPPDSQPGRANLGPRALEMSAYLRTAESLATALEQTEAAELTALVRQAPGLESLDDATAAALLARLEEKVQQLADVLSLDLGADDYRSVRNEAHRQLVHVAADAAGDLARQSAATGRSAALAASASASVPQSQWQPQPQSQSQLAGQADRFDPAESASAPLVAALGQWVDAPPTMRRPSSGDTSSDNQKAEAAASGQAPSAAGASVGKSEYRVALADDDPVLVDRLAAAVAWCRQHRRELSLLLVELPQLEQLVFGKGPEGAAHVICTLSAICRAIDHPGAICVRTGDARFALILPACDRRLAVESANDILRRAHELIEDAGDARSTMLPSIGAATVSVPPKNFPPQDLIDAADRCLYGAANAGGGGVKSIEIY